MINNYLKHTDGGGLLCPKEVLLDVLEKLLIDEEFEDIKVLFGKKKLSKKASCKNASLLGLQYL